MALIALLAGAGIGYALTWYYSQQRTTQVTPYIVILNPIPPTVTQYSNIALSGDVSYAGTPQTGLTVHIFKNDVEIGTTQTDDSGVYLYDYNVTESAGALIFKTGVYE